MHPEFINTGSSEPTGQQMTDGGILMLESGFRTEVIQKLMSMGHVSSGTWADSVATSNYVGREE
jgi:hypothetical protein